MNISIARGVAAPQGCGIAASANALVVASWDGVDGRTLDFGTSATQIAAGLLAPIAKWSLGLPREDWESLSSGIAAQGHALAQSWGGGFQASIVVKSQSHLAVLNVGAGHIVGLRCGELELLVEPDSLLYADAGRRDLTLAGYATRQFSPDAPTQVQCRAVPVAGIERVYLVPTLPAKRLLDCFGQNPLAKLPTDESFFLPDDYGIVCSVG